MAITGIYSNPYVTQGGPLSYLDFAPTGRDVGDTWQSYNRYQIGSLSVASQLVRGTMTFNKDKLKDLDPAYTGYSHIFVLYMPEFMKALANNHILNKGSTNAANLQTNPFLEAKYHYANLKAFIEMGSTSYSGTPSLTLGTAEVSVGWQEKNYSVPTISSYDSTDFSIKCIETYGEPLRHAVEYYISGISDPNAKFQHLHGASVITSKGERPMQPSLSNITFGIMIVQTDQTLHNITDISVWTNCLITQVERGQLDWELGNVDIVQGQTLNFKGIYLPHSNSKAIRDKATELLTKRLHYYKRLDDMTDVELDTKHWDSANDSIPPM